MTYNVIDSFFYAYEKPLLLLCYSLRVLLDHTQEPHSAASEIKNRLNSVFAAVFSENSR